MKQKTKSYHSVRIKVPLASTVDDWLAHLATFDQWGLMNKGTVRIQPPGEGWLGYTIWVEWNEEW